MKVNTSPYLGYITINPNKDYYVTEYTVNDDDFLGSLNIELDRPSNIYVFETKYDEDTGLYVSNKEVIFKQTDKLHKFETTLSEKNGINFVIIIEYDGMKLGIYEQIKPVIFFKKYSIEDLYHSNFYMFETKSGIPYPAHEIGSYSRFEFEIEQTTPGIGYKRIGILYYSSGPSDLIVNKTNVTKHCKTFVQGIMGYNYRYIVEKDFNTIVDKETKMLDAVLSNLTLVTNKYKQNKIILVAESALSKTDHELELFELVNKIIQEPNYEKLIELVESFVEISYYYTATIIKLGQAMQDLIDNEDFLKNIRFFITGLYNDLLDDNTLTELGHTTKLLLSTQVMSTNRSNAGMTVSKSLNEMMSSDVVSGRLNIQGQSIHTGKYASSKILVGHFHENERGYLKHTLVTDRYGKTHKDPFVKNKEQWGKEEDYVYLDLLHASKNIFASSNKMIRGVALLVNKQFKAPPKGTITFKFLNKDRYDENGDIVQIFADKIFYDVYSAVYRAEKIVDRHGLAD